MEATGLWGDLLKSLKENDWAGAVEGVDRFIASDPENYNLHMKKGDIFQKAGNVADAVNSYRLAAWYLREKGFNKKALAVYNLILRLDPDNLEAVDASTKLMMEVMEAESAKGADMVTMDIEAVAVSEVTASEGEAESPLNPLFPLSEEETNNILSKAVFKKFSDNEKVIIEGDTGDSIYIIKRGKAAVFMHLFGREIKLAELAEGDLFGEVAFLTGRTRTATVSARGDLEVYEINRPLLEDVIEKRPEIMSSIQEIYLKRVKDTFRKVKV